MEIHEFFLMLFAILVSARFFGELFAYVGLPSVLGELTAGLVLGPSLLGVIEVNQTIKLLAEIGILLLLFEIGLESDFHQLKSSGKNAARLASMGIVLPFIFGFYVSYYYFNYELIVSLFIAGTLTATSIGITLRVLKDVCQHKTHIAQTVIGAAVIDDIIGVVVLVFLYDFAMIGEINLYNIFKVTALVTIFLIVAPMMAVLLSSAISYTGMRHKVPGFIPTLIVSLILFFGYISHLFGAPEILGSFVAGVALSRRFFLPFGTALALDKSFSQKVKSDMKPITYLFTPIFFVTVGLSVDLSIIDFTSYDFWHVSSLIIIVAFLGKFLAAMFIKGESLSDRTTIGIAMIPRGEIGLIFAELGRTSGILSNEVYATLIFVIIITTLVPPLIIKLIYRNEVCEIDE